MKVHRTPPEGVRVVRRTINYANGARIFEPNGYANASRQFAVGDVGRHFANANASRQFVNANASRRFTGRQFA